MRILPPVWALAAAVTQHVLARGQTTTPTSRSLAGAFAGTSLVLMGGAAREFRRRATTLDPTRPDLATELVTTGPNQGTRNPMYLGLAGLLLAHATARRSLPALLPLAGFVAVMDRLQIPREEAALRKTFGAEYAGYSSRVPRWIGLRSFIR